MKHSTSAKLLIRGGPLLFFGGEGGAAISEKVTPHQNLIKKIRARGPWENFKRRGECPIQAGCYSVNWPP